MPPSGTPLLGLGRFYVGIVSKCYTDDGMLESVVAEVPAAIVC